ncbi:MAG: AraC family transcriptional regulator [Rikenellaceae bacterium]|nr:AraC family transcriptional regulator [Rikenellaceae bacterium]
MQFKKNEHTVFNYRDIFFSYHFSDNRRCASMARDHYLVYVYSGEYRIIEGKKRTVIKPGECVFVRRDNRVNMEKYSVGDEPFRGIFMMLKRPFLRELYQKTDKNTLPVDAVKFKQSAVKINERPEITSLFLSLTPFFDQAVQPSDELMYLKQVEGVYLLLRDDKRFYPTLFDFTQPWKIDILEFLEQNYMYELSVEEIAAFTGRSLSSFKRDFKQVSDLSPQKWIIHRRLKAAYDMIKGEGKRVSDVYTEVGFKNLSHFSVAFKKQYGFSPGK